MKKKGRLPQLRCWTFSAMCRALFSACMYLNNMLDRPETLIRIDRTKSVNKTNYITLRKSTKIKDAVITFPQL